VYALVSGAITVFPPGNTITTGLLDATTTGDLVTGQNVTYQIALNQSIPNGNSILQQFLPELEAFVAPFNPSRITATYAASAIYVSVYYPAMVTVSFQASGTTLYNARHNLLNLSGLTNGTGDPDVDIDTNGTNGVFAEFSQDPSQYPGTQNYRTAACTLYKNLFSSTLTLPFEKDANRSIITSSITTTDPNCTLSSPSPSPIAGIQGGGSSATGGTIAAIVIVVVLIVAGIAAAYIYKKMSKRKQKEVAVQEF